LKFHTLNIALRKRPSKLEIRISILILFILGGIGATIFWIQFRHNPANDSLLINKPVPSTPDAALQGITRDFPIPANLAPSGPVETFSRETLSDKIDGKAELYLSSGVKDLTTQRFRMKGRSDGWMEVFCYDMAKARNGFAVYSAQMREDAVRLSLTPFSYRTENGHYFLNGQMYVEIVGSGGTQEEIAARESLAMAIVDANPAPAADFQELRYFPERYLDHNSISFISRDAFGFDGLDTVFTALYDVDGTEVMVFLSLRPSPSEAMERASAYHSFLLANGGLAVESKGLGSEKVRIVEILDTFELIVVKGSVRAGVREAPNQSVTEKIGRLLMERLAETERTGEAAR